MALAHSKLVPVAFWIAFVVLGLVTSLGAPQKPQARPQGTRHSLSLHAAPAPARIALGDEASRGPGDATVENYAVRPD